MSNFVRERLFPSVGPRRTDGAMDPETQYPVDAVTTEAMKTSKPLGMDMSLDDIVKQRRNANKKRGDGKLSKGGILKVMAGVN